MPLRVALDRRVEELLDLGERDDLVELARRSRASSCRGSSRSGRCSRGRSARGGSRCRPRAATRRARAAHAGRAVGSVMRDRIFSSVLLPAPLRPMMPTTSPGWTSNETSCSAQKSLHRHVAAADLPEAAQRRRGHVGQRGRETSSSRSSRARADRRLLSPSALIAGRHVMG